MLSKQNKKTSEKMGKKNFIQWIFFTWSTKKIFVHSLNSIKSSRKNIWKEFKRLQCRYDLAIWGVIQQLAFVLVSVISELWWALLCESELYVHSLGYMLQFRHLSDLLLFEQEIHLLAYKCYCWIAPAETPVEHVKSRQFSNCCQVLKSVINYLNIFGVEMLVEVS